MLDPFDCADDLGDIRDFRMVQVGLSILKSEENNFVKILLSCYFERVSDFLSLGFSRDDRQLTQFITPDPV